MFDPKAIDPYDIGDFSWMSYACRQNPSAEDYLEYARLDLADGGSPRHRINALANAKRALHIRMEDVCLGFGAVSLENLKGFHRLAKYLKKCGLPAPGVLEKLNTERNSTEHDYATPSLELVEIYVDVACLFISATDRWSVRHPCDISFNEIDKITNRRLGGVVFNWGRGSLTLQIGDAGNRARNYPYSVTYTNSEPEFFEWVKLAVKYSD